MKNGTAVKDSHTTNQVVDIKVGIQALTLIFGDGREFKVPLNLYPTLKGASRQMRQRWRLVGHGWGVHWPDLDLDLTIEGMIRGMPESFPPPPPSGLNQATSAYLVKKANQGWAVFVVRPVTETVSTKAEATRLVRKLSPKGRRHSTKVA